MLFFLSRHECYRVCIFGNVVRTATEDVVLHLLMCKRIPILFYGFESMSTQKSRFALARFCRNQVLYDIIQN